jgi:hypothetical protein
MAKVLRSNRRRTVQQFDTVQVNWAEKYMYVTGAYGYRYIIQADEEGKSIVDSVDDHLRDIVKRSKHYPHPDMDLLLDARLELM